MNRARVAEARAKLHEALDELLDAIEDGDSSAPADRKSQPQRVRRPRLPVVPDGVQVSDTDRLAARAHLRRSGRFIEVKR